MTDQHFPRFAKLVAELASLGVRLCVRPGEYEVNFADGDAATAYTTDDLADAAEHGRAMARANDRPKAEAQTSRATRGRRRPLPRTAKAYNRRLRRQHMRKLRARAATLQKKNQDERTADRGAENVNPSKKTDEIPPA